VRAERGLPEDLIRLCVGIEDPADLIDDLEHALLEAGAITVSAGADQHHLSALLSLMEESLLAVRWRNSHTMSIQ
jgi:hypothetical protein